MSILCGRMMEALIDDKQMTAAKEHIMWEDNGCILEVSLDSKAETHRRGDLTNQEVQHQPPCKLQK